MHQQQTVFENIVGKGEIARNEQFLLFPQCYPLNQIIVSPFIHSFDIISLFAAELEEPKIGISGKRLTGIDSYFLIRSKCLSGKHLQNHSIFSCCHIVFKHFFLHYRLWIMW